MNSAPAKIAPTRTAAKPGQCTGQRLTLSEYGHRVFAALGYKLTLEESLSTVEDVYELLFRVPPEMLALAFYMGAARARGDVSMAALADRKEAP